jgi:hypothetical protein
MKCIFLVEGVRVSLSDYMSIKLGCFTLEEYMLWSNPQHPELLDNEYVPS